MRRLALTSPQRRALAHRDDAGRVRFGTRPRLRLPPHETDRFHVVGETDRIDLIAYDYLGDVELFWVIAEINHLALPMTLTPGVTLRIPTADRLNPEVLKRAR
ncbi:MAG: hypothetical protein RLY93_12335 [Sumerlaeia bacterium]